MTSFSCHEGYVSWNTTSSQSKKFETIGRRYNRPQPSGLKLSTARKYTVLVFLHDCYMWLQTNPLHSSITWSPYFVCVLDTFCYLTWNLCLFEMHLHGQLILLFLLTRNYTLFLLTRSYILFTFFFCHRETIMVSDELPYRWKVRGLHYR